MKRLLLPFILMLSALTMQAQERNGMVSGKVITADGLVVPNAVVFVKGLSRITYTSGTGIFRLSVPQGAQVLVIQSATKKQMEVPVQVIAAEELKLPVIQLKENSYELKEVVITGQYEPQSLRNSVYNVRSISSEMIRLRGATDVKTILSTELGIRFSNDAATGISDPSLMGMSGGSIKILLDGVPMMDRGTAKESLGQIDINMVDRIEIVEGPMSVVFGTDAMAGVINIITKRGGQDNLLINARIQEETAGKEYNAFSDKGTHNEHLSVDWQKKGWQLAASGTRNNFGGWQGNTNGRSKEWLPKDQWLTSATAGYKNAKTDIWYRFNGTDEKLYYYGDYNPDLTDPVVADKKYLSKRWFHQAQGSFFLNDKMNLDAAAAYTDYSRRTLSTNLNINSGKETLSLEPGSQDKDVLKTTFFRSTLQYKLSPMVVLQPGIEFNRNTGKGDRIEGTPEINDYSFFLSSQLQLTDAVQIKPGFRLTKNSVYDAPPVIPSLHTKIKLDKDIDLRLSYARGFRAPILRELYFSFHDTNHDIVGNTNLKAEYSNSFQGSVSWAIKTSPELRLSTILSGFYNDYKNKIETGLLSGSDRINTYLNIDKYKTTGGDLNTSFFWKDLQANLGLAYLGRYNEFSEASATLGSSPEFVWSPELNTSISYLIPKIATNISLFYKFTGKQPGYISADNKVKLVELSSFNTADLSLNKVINKYLTLNGGVKNLFDVTRINNSGAITAPHGAGTSAAIGYGRSFFFGLKLQWSKN